jgi:hypothetical protein
MGELKLSNCVPPCNDILYTCANMAVLCGWTDKTMLIIALEFIRLNGLSDQFSTFMDYTSHLEQPPAIDLSESESA